MGTLQLNTNAQAVSAFTFSDLEPGWGYSENGDWSKNKSITVDNSGTLNLKYRIRISLVDTESSNPLLDNLMVKTTYTKNDVTTLVYEGPLRDYLTGKLVDPNFLPENGEETVTISVRIPITAGNDIQGQIIKFDVLFEATQISNNEW